MNLQKTPKIDILEIKNEQKINWLYNANSQHGLYETLNFIRF